MPIVCRIPEALAFFGLPTRLFDEIIPSINDGLGPEATKCHQQRAKKSFAVFAEMERKKTNKNKKQKINKNLQLWISLPEVDSPHALYFPHLEYHSVPTSLNDMLWLLYQWPQVFKNRKLHTTCMVVSGNRKHISHLLSEHEGNHPMVVYPKFQETTVSRMLHGYFFGRCHNSAHIPD